MPNSPASHNPIPLQQRERQRGSAAARGYGRKWQKCRAAFLSSVGHQCAEPGCTAQATIVDHVEPHRGDLNLFWEASNWQPLCKRHHDQKTARGG